MHNNECITKNAASLRGCLAREPVRGASGTPESGTSGRAATKAEASGTRGNGRECSQRVFEQCFFEQLTFSSEAFLSLCALGTQGATDVGSYSIRLAELQRTSTFGIGPFGNVGVELLPIPLALAKPF